MKAKFLSIALTAILMLSIMAFLDFPPARATPNNPIILPFWTGWDGTNPVGRTNVVDHAKDFGYPELGVREEQAAAPIPDPGTFFGYDFLSHYLMAKGYFGSSDSYCYFSLFDDDSDYQTPFKLKPHTYLSVWYYHYQLGNCMIDAEIVNPVTGEFFYLSEFSYEGDYVVDQNGTRIHPAYRCDDPTDSWQFASFNLSIVYWSCPECLYVTKILVGFDNCVDQATGQARTYFDLLHVSYGVNQVHTVSTDTCSASIIAWDSELRPDGYALTLKVTISGYTNPHFTGYTPYYLNVVLPENVANVEASPEPLGINLEDKNSSLTEVAEFAMDCAGEIIEVLPYGWLFTVYELASSFYGLTSTPSGTTYQWPKAITIGAEHPDYILGEAYIRVFQLNEGLNTIHTVCYADYYYFVVDRWYYYWGVVTEFWFEWNNEPVPNNPPYTPSQPSGPTTGYRNLWYTYSTSTTDPDGDSVRYQFEFTGPSTNVSFTTGWYASGQTGSLTVMWETTDPLGTYYVRVRAQDVFGLWSSWSPSLTVTIVNRSPNTPSQPSGTTSGYTGTSYSYSTSTTDPDGDNVYYLFDWGDGSTTTIGPYASGETVSASHTWGSTGTYDVKVKAKDVYEAWSGYSSSLTVSITSGGGGGGGGCPTLFVWNGTGYVEEALLDIHSTQDVTVDYTLNYLNPAGRLCMLSLRELEPHTSHMDQVKLYAVDSDGNWHECSLILAQHSQLGQVTTELSLDDDVRVDLAPEETTQLHFLLPKDIGNIQHFIFELNGYNRKALLK